MTKSGVGVDITVPKVQPLAITKVRYVGEPIAAVVADSASRSRAMPPMWSMVEYEELQAVIDPYEARQGRRPATLCQGRRTTSASASQAVHGDVEAALANAADQGEGQDPRAALPPDADGAALSLARPIRSPAASPSGPPPRRPLVSATRSPTRFGLEPEPGARIAPEVGGGFGFKFGAYREDFVVSAPGAAS